MKQNLIEKVSIGLLKNNFTVKNLTGSCFDILARNPENILLIKVLEDANSITRDFTEEMKKITSYIKATPLIIAEKAGSKLEDNIIYTRLNILTFNLNTFTNCLKNRFPFVRRSQAGLTASLDGKKMKTARENIGYSLNSLSRKIGVTTKMIVKYENNNSEVTLSRAEKIYDIFGDKVFNRINIFSKDENIIDYDLSDFSKKYVNLGFNASDTSKAPFDIIARKNDEIILTELGDKTNPNLKSLSRLLDADNLVIFNKKKPKESPALSKEEFMEFEKANELIKFLKEFSG